MIADEKRLALVAWNVVAEPGDPVAVALVRALGPERALDWACWAVGAGAGAGVGGRSGARARAGAGVGVGARAGARAGAGSSGSSGSSGEIDVDRAVRALRAALREPDMPVDRAGVVVSRGGATGGRDGGAVPLHVAPAPGRVRDGDRRAEGDRPRWPDGGSGQSAGAHDGADGTSIGGSVLAFPVPPDTPGDAPAAASAPAAPGPTPPVRADGTSVLPWPRDSSTDRGRVPSPAAGGPASTLAGPASTLAGPASTLAGPASTLAGPASTLAGPASTLAGPASTLAGPASTLTEAASALTGPAARRVLGRALSRWAPRLMALEPRRALDAADRIGCRLLVPGDPGWPTVLDDLDATAPLCLWVRGPADLHALSARSVALVGARAATPYGEHVAADLAAGIAEAGGLVVSGGAYGIDVAAHRGALSAGGITVALLAGGVDRTYPAGNRDLLESLAREHGAVVAECPPGTAPVRSRFLLRNRLIAALAGATVVVEAAWRSGALSTAAHAGALLRPLGAVPGPVTSMASVGCHRPLRDGAAVCVTSTADVLELIGPPGGAVPERRAGRAPAPRGPASPLPGSDDTAQEDAAPEGGTTRAPDRGEHDLGASDLDVLASDTRGGSRYVPDPRAPDPRSPDLRTPAAEEPAPEGPDPYPAASDDPADLGPADRADLRPADRADLRPADRADLRPDGPVDFRPDDPRTRVLDALPLRGALDVTTLARRAGLAREEVEAALGSLDLSGRVRRREGRWSIVHRHP